MTCTGVIAAVVFNENLTENSAFVFISYNKNIFLGYLEGY